MKYADAAVVFDGVTKSFRYFDSPLQRVKEALHPLGKVYHTPLPVLRDVSFTIPRGQTVGVLGPNGVGKSTLLHLAAGVIEPNSGAVKVYGKVFALLDLTCGFAPELTGRENVRFFHDVIARREGDAAETERSVQAFAEIGEYFDRPVRTYSAGMLLRLAFAAAVATEPDVLLIDEVIAVGDARFQQKCFRRIRELRDGGTTILFVTHATDTVPGLCDRVLLFERGEIVFDGEASAGVDRYYQLFFKAPARPSPEASPERHRYGAGGARVLRSYATVDGVNETAHLKRGERVTVAMDVEFERAVAAPHFGFSCSTKEGVRVYATTTTLLGATPAPAAAGERRRVEMTYDVSVAVGDIFIDLSVFEAERGSIGVLEVCLGTLHLTVSSERPCMGVVDLDASFAEKTLRRGPADAVLAAHSFASTQGGGEVRR